MIRARPDLDGLRLIAPGRPEVFLMFGGRRHQVSSSAVYDALWNEVEGLVSSFDVDTIELGPPLVEGSCLIRPDGDVAIHLLTATAEGPIRHFVPTYESLLDFAFDEGRVRNVPRLLLDAVPAGEDLVSAADRARSA